MLSASGTTPDEPPATVRWYSRGTLVSRRTELRGELTSVQRQNGTTGRNDAAGPPAG